MPTRAALLALTLGLWLAPGCAPRLDEKKSFSLEPQGSQNFDLPAVSKPQKVTVEFTSTAADVSVYLIKDATDNDGLDSAPPKEKTLESKQGKSGSLTAEVPASTATRVIVRGAGKKTEVTLTMTNR